MNFEFRFCEIILIIQFSFRLMHIITSLYHLLSIYHKTITNLDILVGDIEQNKLVCPRLEGIFTRPAHCDINRFRGILHPKINSKQPNQRPIRVHSLRKHRQQLASCATLWRFFSSRDRERELSFLLLFVFSLRKAKKEMVKEIRTRAAQHTTATAGEKN